MSRLRSLHAAHDPSAATPGLRVIDESQDHSSRRAMPSPTQRFPVPPRWEALSPMPLAGQQAPVALAGEDEDGLDDFLSPDEFAEKESFLPRQARENGKLRELPRLVPLQNDLVAAMGDPWAIHSLMDLLKLYLPELSISTGVVAVSGLIAGRVVHRFGGGVPGPEVLASYLVLQALCLALMYVSAKDSSSLRVKVWMRKHLLATLLIFGVHLLAYGLLIAGR